MNSPANYIDPNGMYPDSWQRPGETAVAYNIRMNSPELYNMMYSDGGGGSGGGFGGTPGGSGGYWKTVTAQGYSYGFYNEELVITLRDQTYETKIWVLYDVQANGNGLSNAAGAVGVVGTFMGTVDGTFRVTNGTKGMLSPKYYASGWKGGSLIKIKTFVVAKVGNGLGNAANVVTTGVAYYQIANGTNQPIDYADATVGNNGYNCFRCILFLWYTNTLCWRTCCRLWSSKNNLGCVL